LHGADTCTRTQTVVQLKWCAASKNPEDFTQNPPRGDARLDVELRSAAVPAAAEAGAGSNEDTGARSNFSFIEDAGTGENATLETKGDSGLFVLKYSPESGLLWWFQASGDLGSSVQGSAVALGEGGDVWVPAPSPERSISAADL
jgi:hypothetical protein